MTKQHTAAAQSRPLRLTCQAQSYAWGKVGGASKVAQLMQASAGFAVDDDKPYAELWMGTHPNVPSLALVDGANTVPLKACLTEQSLSSKIAKQYSNDLPFLFKVLSINKALSIQAHPDKKLAEKLFAEHPEHYKDPNHKPEMAVALTPFEAFLKFQPLNEISKHFQQYETLKALVDESILKDFLERAAQFGNSTNDKDIIANRSALRKLFACISRSSDETVKTLVPKLISEIEKKSDKSELDSLVLRLNKEYPGDIGIFCAFLLNYVKLQPGEAIFLAANEPHAYIYGDCIECMAASDNVVRSGLTPKFRDVETLISMLTYNYGPADKQKLKPVKNFMGLKHTLLYDPPIDEFSIMLTTLAQSGDSECFGGIDGPSIFVVTEGSGELKFEDENKKQVSEKLERGYIYFVGAGIKYSLVSNGGLITYRAFCTVA